MIFRVNSQGLLLLLVGGALEKQNLFVERSDGDLDVYEIKRDKARISLADLAVKTEAFFRKNPELKSRGLNFKSLSLADV